MKKQFIRLLLIMLALAITATLISCDMTHIPKESTDSRVLATPSNFTITDGTISWDPVEVVPSENNIFFGYGFNSIYVQKFILKVDSTEHEISVEDQTSPS